MGEWKERGLAMWERFDKRQRYIMLGSALAILVLIFGVSFWYGGKPDMVPLFTDMETKDAGEVANQLREANISYEVQENKSGTTILVPTTNVHEARLNLATQGLPRGNKGFEIFDDSKLGVTEFQNRVNYLQALQGELTRTIEQLEAVEKARVHIVLPEDSLYKKEEKPATASIMLRLKPHAELTKKEVKGIVNLAAHSVKGLTPENITIVDDTGKIMNDPDDQDENSIGVKTLTQLDMTRKVQDNIEKKVQSLLDQTLGDGRAFARVSVELDFDDRLTDRQTFTPVVDDAGIIRSQQDISESYVGSSTNPGGPAGVQSNVPGYIAQESNANAEYEKQESTKNYEINEDVTQPQQESILRTVSSAAGINPQRGDTISVEPLPFSTEAAERRAAEEQAEKDREDRIFYTQVGLALLVIALIVGGVLMYRRKKRLEREAAEEAQRAEEERLAEERAAAIAAGEVEEEELSEEEQQQLNQKAALLGLIETKPEEVALLVKTWLSEEE